MSSPVAGTFSLVRLPRFFLHTLKSLSPSHCCTTLAGSPAPRSESADGAGRLAAVNTAAATAASTVRSPDDPRAMRVAASLRRMFLPALANLDARALRATGIELSAQERGDRPSNATSARASPSPSSLDPAPAVASSVATIVADSPPCPRTARITQQLIAMLRPPSVISAEHDDSSNSSDSDVSTDGSDAESSPAGSAQSLPPQQAPHLASAPAAAAVAAPMVLETIAPAAAVALASSTSSPAFPKQAPDSDSRTARVTQKLLQMYSPRASSLPDDESGSERSDESFPAFSGSDVSDFSDTGSMASATLAPLRARAPCTEVPPRSAAPTSASPFDSSRVSDALVVHTATDLSDQDHSADRAGAVALDDVPAVTSASAVSSDDASDASDSEASFISDEEAKVSRVADVLRRMFLSTHKDGNDHDDDIGNADELDAAHDDLLWDSEAPHAESVWPRADYPPNSLGLEPPATTATPAPPPPNSSNPIRAASTPVASPRIMRPAPASASAALQSPAPIEYAPIEAIPAEDDATAQISRALTEFDSARFIERLAASMRAIIAPSMSLADEVDRFAVVAPPPPPPPADDADAFDDTDAFALVADAVPASRSDACLASAVPLAPVLVDEARLAACITAQDALDAASAAALVALRAEADRARACVADLLESAQRRESAAVAAKQSFQTRFVEEESQFKQQVCRC
jgi:hypothetical protein